jgi:hypothetical protein
VARLADGKNLVLDLTPMDYQSAPGDSEQWLFVYFHLRDGAQEWSVRSPAFTIAELQKLVAWIRALANDAPLDWPFWGGIENNLSLYLQGEGDQRWLRAELENEFRPPGFRWGEPGEEEPVTMDLRPSRESLLDFAQELEEELRAFPHREYRALLTD